MKTVIIKTQVITSNIDNAKKVGAIFKNISENVDEKDLMTFYEKIKNDKGYLANVIKKLDSPLVKKFL
jgi:RNA binding exosome subunit